MKKRLFVIQTPEPMPDGGASIAKLFEEVAKDCGIDARCIVLDGDYTLSEIEDKEPEDGGGE